MTTYLACDPGVGTGLVYWDSEDPGALLQVELPLNEVKEFVDRYEGDVNICERFLISERTLRGKIYYESLWIEGYFKLQYPDTHFQTAAQAKGYADDDMLRHLGWHIKSKDDHANDATRHLVYRLTRDKDPYIMSRLREIATQA